MQFLPGDIAACFGADAASRVISAGTWSPLAPAGLRWGPSHVALLCEHDGRMTWVESTSHCRHACLVRRRPVNGAQAHLPEQRVQDYVSGGGRVDVYRLTEINRLSTAEGRLLTRILIDHFVCGGLRYDLGGALLSGTRAFQLTRLFPGADLDELFCSELVAALVMRLNRMNHANPTRFNPGRLMRELVRIGKYRRVECCAPATLSWRCGLLQLASRRREPAPTAGQGDRAQRPAHAGGSPDSVIPDRVQNKPHWSEQT
jgi:hypothetical protein